MARPTRSRRRVRRADIAHLAWIVLALASPGRAEAIPTNEAWVVALFGQSNAGRVASRSNAGGANLDLPPGALCLDFDAEAGKFTPEPPDDHYGAEVTLAQAVAARHPGAQVVILRDAIGGQGMHIWYGQGGAQERLLSFARQVARYRAPARETHLLGYCWMQGETDAQSRREADAYYSRLCGVVGSTSRPWLGAPIPFVVCRISSPFEFTDIVRTAQEKAAAKFNNVALLSSDEVNPQRDIHYPPAAYLNLGYAMASNLFLIREKLAAPSR